MEREHLVQAVRMDICAQGGIGTHISDLDEHLCRRRRLTPQFGSVASNGAGCTNARLSRSSGRQIPVKFRTPPSGLWARVSDHLLEGPQ